MEVKLMTNLDEILPNRIEFNYEELDESLKQLLVRYKGKESTDAYNYAKRKSERASLNKLGKALDDVRKGVKQRLLSVMDSGNEDNPSFNEQIKSLIGSVNMVSGEIDSGIKEYEEKVKADRKEKILCAIENIKNSSSLPKWAKDSQWFVSWANEQMLRKKDNWLNMGMDFNLIMLEIKNEVNRCEETIEPLEQAMKDDSELTKIKGRNSLAVRFNSNDALNAIVISREDEKIARRKEEEAKKAQLEQMALKVKPVQEQESNNKSTEQEMYSCEMRFVGTLSAMNNLKEYLEMNKDITYSVTKHMEVITMK